MSRKVRHRPRTGRGGIMPGTEGGLAGLPGRDKAEPGAGEPVGRQLGLDSRDIPGGKPHLVNPESPPSKAAPKDPRPLFEGLNAHGVVDPSGELGYTDPPADVKPGPRPVPLPKLDDAVPVYIVETSGSERKHRQLATLVISCPAAGSQPARICSEDPNRVAVHLFNEAASGGNNIRFGPSVEDLVGVTATAPGDGALLPPAAGYLKVETQGDLFAISQAASVTLLSVVIETEVAT